MPQSGKDTVKKKSTAKTAAKSKAKTTAKAKTSAKRPAKKAGSRGSAGAGKRRASQKRRKSSKSAWWSWPVTIIMLFILTFVGLFVSKEMKNYEDFKVMRETVSFEGFYPGVSIEGVDVSGRSLNEVLTSLGDHEKNLRNQISLTLVCGSQSWKITPDDLDYQTDYVEVVSSAYQLGREGSVRERFESIRRMKQNNASYSITRGYDISLLRLITDQIADELSWDAVNATVIDFDVDTKEFTFTNESDGRYVDADQLYRDALSMIQSGVGGQTLLIAQETDEPTYYRRDLEKSFGQITEARTSTSGSNNNRINNIELALKTLNGTCIEPGETFSFNGVVGQRTKDRGYKMAGAFADGLVTEELGGGICQVSTTLFNAVVKANLEIVERQPHSRPIGYVDEGKDAAVSWPSQDFKFTNNTEHPVYLVAGMSETKNRCIISVYGQQLPDGMSIVVEAETTEVLEPEEDRYIYTSSLPTGYKELVEAAREGYRAVAYKVYLDANGDEIRREVLCYSTYAAAGAVYKVGQ